MNLTPLTIITFLLWLTPALAQSPFAPPKPKEAPKADTFVAPQMTAPQPPKQKPLGVVNGKKMCVDLLTGQIVDCIADPNDPYSPPPTTSALPVLPGAVPTAAKGRNPAIPITLPQAAQTPPPAVPAMPDLSKLKAEARAEAKAEIKAEAVTAKEQALKEALKETAPKFVDLEKKIAEANTRAQAAETKTANLTKQIESKNQEYMAQKAHIESLQKDLAKLREEQKEPVKDSKLHPEAIQATSQPAPAPTGPTPTKPVKPESKPQTPETAASPKAASAPVPPPSQPSAESAPSKVMPQAPKPAAEAKSHGEQALKPEIAATPTPPKPTPSPEATAPAKTALEAIITAPESTYAPSTNKPVTPAEPQKFSAPAPQPTPAQAPPKEPTEPVTTPAPQTNRLLPSKLEQRISKRDLPLLPGAGADKTQTQPAPPPIAPTSPSQEAILGKARVLETTTNVHKGQSGKAKLSRGKEMSIYEFSTSESACPDALAYRVGPEIWNWVCADKVKVVTQNKPIPYYESN